MADSEKPDLPQFIHEAHMRCVDMVKAHVPNGDDTLLRIECLQNKGEGLGFHDTLDVIEKALEQATKDRKELESFRRAQDEALNSGDGTTTVSI